MKKNIRRIIIWFSVSLLAFILLIIVFKIINQVINGSEDWLNTIKSTNVIENNNIFENWFTGSKGLKNFLTGPIGFDSFVQFKLLGNVNSNIKVFLLPIFLDLLINWIFVIGFIIFILLFVIFTIKFFIYNKNKNKFKVIEETETGQDLVWKNKNGEILTRSEALNKTNEELKALNLQKVKGKNGEYIRSISNGKKNNNLDK